jgi:hypothetical protein
MLAPRRLLACHSATGRAAERDAHPNDQRRGSIAAMHHLCFRDTSIMIPQPDGTSP